MRFLAKKVHLGPELRKSLSNFLSHTNLIPFTNIFYFPV